LLKRLWSLSFIYSDPNSNSTTRYGYEITEDKEKDGVLYLSQKFSSLPESQNYTPQTTPQSIKPYSWSYFYFHWKAKK